MASRRIRVAALLLFVCVATSASAQADLNVISAIRARSGTIEIVGTKKPNFTTFTMSDPARLVVDVSEAVFKGVPQELQVGDGVVTSIKTAAYGSDQSAIARILVGFTDEFDTEIETRDGTIIVRVVRDDAPIASSEIPEHGTLVASAATPESRTASGDDAQKRPEEEPRIAEQRAREEAERKRL